MMLIGFGIGFELPVVVFYLVIFNIVPYAKLRSNWRIVYVVLMLVASAATPDWSPYTMGGLFVALVVLYEAQHAARARHASQAHRRPEARRARRGRRRLTSLTHRAGRASRARDGHHARHPRGVVRRCREGRRAHASPRSASASASSPRSRSSRSQFAFEALTPGTMAEGATLVVTHGGPPARAAASAACEYDHDRFEMLCPACGSFNVEPLTGGSCASTASKPTTAATCSASRIPTRRRDRRNR